MITVKIKGRDYTKVSGQLTGTELPDTFEIEDVDVSGAGVSPEQAMAQVKTWQPFQNLDEYQLRMKWKDAVKQAAHMVLESMEE